MSKATKQATETKPVDPKSALEAAVASEQQKRLDLDDRRNALALASASTALEIEREVRSLEYELRDCERETQRCRSLVAEVARGDDLAELERLTLEADPKKGGRAQILECAKRKRESDRRALEAVSDAELVIAEKRAVHARAVELARKLGVPGPSFPALPVEQFRWALLAMTDSGFEKLARDELEKISPGTQLGDLDPRAFLIALAEHGPEAALEPLRRRDAERAQRERDSVARRVGAQRAMSDRIAELIVASRTRRLRDEESRELAELEAWRGEADGVHKYLARESAAAAVRSIRSPVTIGGAETPTSGRENLLP